MPFIWSVISESNVDDALSLNLVSTEQEDIVFEEGGLLKKNQIKYFKEFSHDKRFWNVIERNLSSTSNNIYEISDSFQIKSLRRNDCKANRCLQYKVPFSNIPLILTKGLIGIEDYRFLDHFGVDPVSILRAIVYDIKAGKLVQGGSTLTQQLAKNLFFSNEKSFVRKIKEAIVSIYLEIRFDKSDILQTYFNEVFWGSLQGIRIKGIQSASTVYFGRSVEELRPYEASILVSMLKGPYYYHPIKRTERLRERADFIFRKLEKMNLFSQVGNELWEDHDWDNWIQRLKDLQAKSVLESIYLSANMRDQSLQYSNFILIQASKDLLEKKAEVSKDLSVKVVYGNKSAKASYYSRFERDKKRAISDEAHQIGSTIKPLLYGIAEDLGLSLNEEIQLEPLEMKLKSGVWRPRESHEISEKVITHERALQESFNIPLIRAVEKIGFDNFEAEMGQRFKDLKKPLSEYPAQLLGAVELSVSELYSTYANFLTKECKREEPNVISALYDPSKTTIRRSVSRDLKDQRFFGKTGTTNNGYDNWFVGFDGNKLFVIWTGHEGVRDNKKSLPLYGSSTSFKIFQETILFSGKRLGAMNCNF